MKEPSLDLFFLIKSLTKSEKRYLKLGLTTKQTEHIKLFDAILAQGVYDEEKLKRDNKDSAFATNMPVYKHYLYQYILNKLQQYQSKDIEEQVITKITFAKILAHRKLYSQAQKQLNAAKRVAQKHELPDLELLVLQQEIKLHALYAKTDFDLLQHLHRAKKDTIQQIEEDGIYTYLFNEVSQLQLQIQAASQQDELDKLEKWREHPLLEKDIKTIPIKNKILLLKAKAIYHFTKGEVFEASTYNKKLLDTLDQSPQYNKRYPEEYISTLNNFIIDQLRLNNTSAFEEGLKILEEIPHKKEFKQIENIGARMFHQRYLLFFNYCFDQKEYAKAMAALPKFTTEFEANKQYLKQHQFFTLCYLVGVLAFGAKAYSLAQDWIIPILQDNKENVVLDIMRYSHLLELLLHFELGNEEFVMSLIPSTQRALKKHGKISEGEKILIQYLRKTISSPSKKERKLLKEAALVALEARKAQTKEQKLFNYLPIIGYLEGI